MPVLLVDLETSVVNRFAFRIDPPPHEDLLFLMRGRLRVECLPKTCSRV